MLAVEQARCGTGQMWSAGRGLDNTQGFLTGIPQGLGGYAGPFAEMGDVRSGF